MGPFVGIKGWRTEQDVSIGLAVFEFRVRDGDRRPGRCRPGSFGVAFPAILRSWMAKGIMTFIVEIVPLETFEPKGPKGAEKKTHSRCLLPPLAYNNSTCFLVPGHRRERVPKLEVGFGTRVRIFSSNDIFPVFVLDDGFNPVLYGSCVGIIGQSPTTTSTTTTSGNGIATPTPTQTGMVGRCDSFYLVVSGDGCWDIAAEAGIDLDDFYA